MQSVQDLRSKAVDRKREVKSKSKWAEKSGWSQKWVDDEVVDGIPVSTGKRTRPPAQYSSKRWTELRRHQNAKEIHRIRASRKQDFLGDGRDDDEDSLESDRDFSIESTSPPGPGFDGRVLDGTSVLGTAVTTAANRFEDGQIVKLVKEEYDDLCDMSEDEHQGASIDEDDFEFV